MSGTLRLDWLDRPGTEYAVCRLDADAAIPAWASLAPSGGGFIGVTRTADELSIVVSAGDVPVDVQAERGWAGIRVVGPLDFGLTGVIARLATALADASVSVFVISTYDTDILLVKHAALDAAVAALADAADVSALRST